MFSLRIGLAISTLLIYAFTVYAVVQDGINWPAVFFGDLLEFDWRSQFNFDFLIHLFLLATWVAWREGFTARGLLFGFLSIFMGGMFGFPYILYATYRAKGDPKGILMGVHAGDEVASSTGST